GAVIGLWVRDAVLDSMHHRDLLRVGVEQRSDAHGANSRRVPVRAAGREVHEGCARSFVARYRFVRTGAPLEATAMNENDSRDLLLVQAYEGIGNPAWGAGDRQWASDAALRKLGAEAADETWLGTRARLAAARLRERDATARMLDRASRWPPG